VNTTKEMPQHIFETGDCFTLDSEAETGVRTHRRLAAGMAGPRAGYADARSVLEALARELDLTLVFEPLDHPTFIPGRCARVLLSGQSSTGAWGVLGEVHPEVLEGFGMTQSVALLEVDLSLLLQ
jgi:phenylalanyl-tRNA synthetase beta chain